MDDGVQLNSSFSGVATSTDSNATGVGRWGGGGCTVKFRRPPRGHGTGLPSSPLPPGLCHFCECRGTSAKSGNQTCCWRSVPKAMVNCGAYREEAKGHKMFSLQRHGDSHWKQGPTYDSLTVNLVVDHASGDSCSTFCQIVVS